jgi:hypothetical protein
MSVVPAPVESPCAFRIRAIEDRLTRWPTFFNAPTIRV